MTDEFIVNAGITKYENLYKEGCTERAAFFALMLNTGKVENIVTGIFRTLNMAKQKG